MSSRLNLLSFAVPAILAFASLPVVHADSSNFAKTCYLDIYGRERCYLSTAVRAIIGGSIMLLAAFALAVSLYIRRRRAQRAFVAIGTAPAMGYANGATFASTYDPNGPQYPAQTHPFVGNGAPGASAPIPPAYAGYQEGYAPHQGPPSKAYV